MTRTIIKRDGTEVLFNIDKVNAAIQAAKPKDGEDLFLTYVGGETVEEVQDEVEKLLMLNDPEAAKRFILYRQRKAEMREVEIPDAISDYILHSKYAKDGESWDDVVDRCMNMHLKKFPEHVSVTEGNTWRTKNRTNVHSTIRHAFQFVKDKKVLPSMRSLQFAGPAIEQNSYRMYNCSFSKANRVDFFERLFYLLLSGCGVGYSVQRENVNKLPVVSAPDEDNLTHYSIPDSIEGWSYSIFHLMKSYFIKGYGYTEFNYSLIRKRGEPLVTSGGRAPGHLPLKKVIRNVRKIMDGAVGRQLRPFEVHRICCFIAEGVLAGGIRRSSLICLFDPEDSEMSSCKQSKDWFQKMPELAMANNSSYNVRHADNIVQLKGMRDYGEPGLFFAPVDGVGTNPCAEIGLDPGDEAFAFCNLSEINVARCKTKDEFLEACWAATTIGTLQAAYTDTFTPQDLEVAQRDALLGVSLTGIQDNLECLDWLKEGAEYCVEVNAAIAGIIGINPAARITCVKPSGTASLLLGGVGSGIHAHHAQYYLRRVTAVHTEDVFREFAEQNPHMVERKPDGSYCVVFPMKGKKGVKGLDFLELIKKVRTDWVAPGDNILRKHRAHRVAHNVSATVELRDDEWLEAERWINKEQFTVSFIGETHGYAFAPREEVETEAQQARFRELARNYTPVSYNSGASDFGSACEGPSCEFI